MMATCRFCNTEYIYLPEVQLGDSVCPNCRLRQKDGEDQQSHFTNPRPSNTQLDRDNIKQMRIGFYGKPADTPFHQAAFAMEQAMFSNGTLKQLADAAPIQFVDPEPEPRTTATATKVWKVECPCGTNWVYDEFGDSLPDECENCGRQVEIMPGEVSMDMYDRDDLATWLGIDSYQVGSDGEVERIR